MARGKDIEPRKRRVMTEEEKHDREEKKRKKNTRAETTAKWALFGMEANNEDANNGAAEDAPGVVNTDTGAAPDIVDVLICYHHCDLMLLFSASYLRIHKIQSRNYSK